MKQLLLVGGGHAHLPVLRALAAKPLPGWRVCLLTSHPRQIYSGMLPGWVAGHYTLDDCSIELAGLAARAGAELVLDSAMAVDAGAQVVTTVQGRELRYDVLSLDVGSAPAIASLDGAQEHGTLIRPIEGFVAQWAALVERLRAGGSRHDVTVLGGGAAGLELAFALRHRGRAEGWSHLQVQLAGAEDLPLSSMPEGACRRALDLMAERGIPWLGRHRAVALEPQAIRLDGGGVLRSDTIWVVTGGAAPAWLGSSTLAKDDAGFVRVNASLQSLSHPNVFAAGDTASHPAPLPRSGVYAVRAGPWLARNLDAYCRGQALADWQPQRRALYLVSTGDRAAMAVWGGWSWSGRWVWNWKDWIDRGFVRSFA